MLENSYLCGSNNNTDHSLCSQSCVVICLKIPTFVVATTTPSLSVLTLFSCDLLENSYLCGSNNNLCSGKCLFVSVVICLKIPTFVVATTTPLNGKYVAIGCDLLENSYLCGSNNNKIKLSYESKTL